VADEGGLEAEEVYRGGRRGSRRAWAKSWLEGDRGEAMRDGEVGKAGART